MPTKKILTIDDDDDFCYAVKRIVTGLGHGCQNVPTMAQALEQVKDNEFDLILLDVGLPDGNGLDLLPSLKALPSPVEVVIITGAGDAQGAELAILNGAWDYLEKSASTKKISLTITRVLQYQDERKKAQDNEQITYLKRESIIGSSPKMKQALDRVAKAATCNANVLITGETGTGKEVFANAIHSNSGRADRELVTVDCASLPESLAENLLFGHKKGVYTGADDNSLGLIKMADQGSLFLDEIGELTLPLQKTLLRVLQEKRFRPLGGGKEIKSDFRLIAATNRNLEEEVAQDRFRKDLLFRIRSLHIQLPDLRDRDQDIKKLARHYLDYFCDQQTLDSKGVSSDFFEVLDAYPWPGNVRELAHTMEHVVIAALNEPTVFPTHLPKRLRVHVVTSGLTNQKKENMGNGPAGSSPVGISNGYESGKLTTLAQFREETLIKYEEKYLRDLMAQTRTIKEACNVSDLSRSRLYALLKKYNLSPN